MPENLGGSMGAAGSPAPAAPAISSMEGSMEGLGAPNIPETTPEAPKPEPIGAQATGPVAANKVTEMATQGPEKGMTQLANLDVDALDAEAEQQQAQTTTSELTGQDRAANETGDKDATTSEGQIDTEKKAETDKNKTTEKTMREKLSGLSGNNREEDPRWKKVYDQMPDYISKQPPPSAGEDAYQKWMNDSKTQIASYREKADEALRASDPQAFENYKRYGMYTNPDGTKNLRIDPEAKQLFFDENGNHHTPTPEEISQFEAQYPEKAAFYSEDISALRSQDASINNQSAEDTPSAGAEKKPKDDTTSEDQANTEKKVEMDENETTEKKDEKTEGEEAKSQTEQVSATEQRMQQLENRLSQLESRNADLESVVKVIIELLPAIKLLLEQQQAKEQDPKKKENLAMLLLKIAALIAFGGGSIAGKAAESVTKQG